MKKIVLIFLLFINLYFPTAVALSAVLKQKYPFSVLTEDYGILNEIDLNSDFDGIEFPKNSPKNGDFYLYWQCFKRDDVSIILRDIGYSSFNLDENDAELTITAYSHGEVHLYGMRRNWPVSDNEKQFNHFQKLVNKQNYICLEGAYFYYKDKIIDGKKERIHYWTFEKLKTKRGCASYFLNGCHY